MTFPETKKDKRTSGTAGDTAMQDKPENRRSKRAASGEIGTALRSVYDGALNENIPPEMLDLLGKLG